MSKDYTIPRSLMFIQDKVLSNFMRVSRYDIINLDYLESVDSSENMIGLRNVPTRFGLGNKYLKDLLTVLDV